MSRASGKFVDEAD